MFLRLAVFHAARQLLLWKGHGVGADIWSRFSPLLLGAALDPHLVTCAAPVRFQPRGADTFIIFLVPLERSKQMSGRKIFTCFLPAHFLFAVASFSRGLEERQRFLSASFSKDAKAVREIRCLFLASSLYPLRCPCCPGRYPRYKGGHEQSCIAH